MRLGVLDVGSNTIHLQVVDAHPGARPSPASSQKFELRLTDYLDTKNQITQDGVIMLNHAIAEVLKHAKEFEVEEILAFATSAIREAGNGSKILKDINRTHAIELQILTGVEEAQLTYLAARRWFGWSSGRLLVVDIGGGSLELAIGDDEAPESSISLPIGAARMTRQFLHDDPYTTKEIRNLEKHISTLFKVNLTDTFLKHKGERFIATSKTLRTLARITSTFYGDSPKKLQIDSLVKAVEKLSLMTIKERTELPGVSVSRAKQIVAGGIVAREIMNALEIDELEICSWALREGIVLKWLDWMQPLMSPNSTH